MLLGATTAAVLGQPADDAGSLGAFEVQVDELPGASAAAFSADGGLAVLCPDASEIALVRDAQVVQRVAMPAATGINAARAMGDIAHVGPETWVIGGANGLFMVRGDPPRATPLGALRDVSRIAVSPDGQWIAAAMEDGCLGQIAIVSALDGHVQRTIAARGDFPLRKPSGIAIDAEGAVYVADEMQCRIWKVDSTGTIVWAMGEYGDPPGFFSAPGDIALAGERLYVAEGRNHRVAVVDVAGGTVLDAWGTHAMRPREGRARLHYPQDIAISIDGTHLAVCEPWEDRVQIFRRAGAGEALERTKYSDLGSYTHFGDFAAIDGRLLAVLQPDSHRVLMYDIGASHAERPEPVLIGAYGEYGERYGLLREPGALAIDRSARRLYVHDRGNHRLCAMSIDWSEAERLRFNPTLLSFARAVDLESLSHLKGLPRVIAPSAMVVLADGSVMATDPANGAIWIFDRSLRDARRVDVQGSGGAWLPVALAVREHDGQTRIAVGDAAQGCVLVGVLDGDRVQLQRAPFPRIPDPRGVSILQNGSVVATDRAGHRVLLASGATGDWSSLADVRVLSNGKGTGVGQVFKPRACVVSDDGRTFVVDRGNHRLVVWSPNLECIAVFGARLFTVDALREIYHRGG